MHTIATQPVTNIVKCQYRSFRIKSVFIYTDSVYDTTKLVLVRYLENKCKHVEWSVRHFSIEDDYPGIVEINYEVDGKLYTIIYKRRFMFPPTTFVNPLPFFEKDFSCATLQTEDETIDVTELLESLKGNFGFVVSFNEWLGHSESIFYRDTAFPITDDLLEEWLNRKLKKKGNLNIEWINEEEPNEDINFGGF